MTDHDELRDPPLNPPPRVPLKAAGNHLWNEIASRWVLRPDEQEILLQAAITADHLTTLDRVIASLGDDVMVPGSRPGTWSLHPAYAERRQAAALQAQNLARLRLPDLEDESEEEPAPPREVRKPMSRSEAGRVAARARWGRRG